MLTHLYYAERIHEDYERRVNQFLVEQSILKANRQRSQAIGNRVNNGLRMTIKTVKNYCEYLSKENFMYIPRLKSNPITKTSLNLAFAVIVTIVSLLFLLIPAHADDFALPVVPINIQVPAGNELFLMGHAVGTQNYICLPSGAGVKFTLFTPQATLFEGKKQLTTHYFSPNPVEGGAIRATWQHSKDTSTVWGRVMDGHSSADLAYVAPGAIPWLLVTIVGAQEGDKGGDKLEKTTFIQRVNTVGGVAPAMGCASATDVGNRAFVPYTTDYYFYKKAN